LIIGQLSSSRDLTVSLRKQAETRLDLDKTILPHLDFFVKLGPVAPPRGHHYYYLCGDSWASAWLLPFQLY
jgi:hypothetical protein